MTGGELTGGHQFCRPGIFGETMAIKEALSWAKKRSRIEMEIESDCFLAVQAIHSSGQMLYWYTTAHVIARTACSTPDRVFYGSVWLPGLYRMIVPD